METKAASHAALATAPKLSKPRVPGMARTVALAFVLFVITAADAQATAFRVVVVPGFGLDDLPALADRGAIGLLVPGAGPETSAARARAALVRGKVTNDQGTALPGAMERAFQVRAWAVARRTACCDNQAWLRLPRSSTPATAASS